MIAYFDSSSSESYFSPSTMTPKVSSGRAIICFFLIVVDLRGSEY